MDDPLAVALKFGFLAVLYLFLLWVSRSALRDLARGQEAALGVGAGRGARASSAGATSPTGRPAGRRSHPSWW